MTAVPKEDFDIHAKQDLEGVEKKWKQFQEENDIEALEQIDERVLTEAIQKDLGYVSKMTVQELFSYTHLRAHET